MQEEVNEKTVSLCITGGKVTVRLLKQAMMRFLAAVEKEKAEKARKQQTKAPPDARYLELVAAWLKVLVEIR